MARRLLIVGLILAAVLLATALIWPLVQQAQMETPLADVVSGVQRGKVADIAACFTPDASAVSGTTRVPVTRLLKRVGTAIDGGLQSGALRFQGISQVRKRTRDMAEVDFALTFFYTDEVGHRLPVPRQGHARLQRIGWFTWRITEIGADDPTFGAAIAGIASQE